VPHLARQKKNFVPRFYAVARQKKFVCPASVYAAQKKYVAPNIITEL
jgi:hypothetical protein